MSRGGRRGGGSRRGPDMSWADYPDDDEKDAASPPANVPGPLFPRRNLRMPKPPNAEEMTAAREYLAFRDRCRAGPLYAVLDEAQFLDSQGKAHKRSGFDPFNDQQRYSTRHFKKRRTVPDLSENGRGDYGYTLRLFPQELWGILDPRQRLPDWKEVSEDSVAFTSLGAGLKRKRSKKSKILTFNDDIEIVQGGPVDKDSEEEDEILDGSRRRRVQASNSRKSDPTSKPSSQKRGLDAEDDYPDLDQDPNDDEVGEGEDEMQDSEFEESDDGGGDDYNAEQYFDAGEEEDDGGGYGRDDEGAY